jgi:hypothetical protein
MPMLRRFGIEGKPEAKMVKRIASRTRRNATPGTRARKRVKVMDSPALKRG